ncbi:MAG: helix-turn-helix domain-containing protein [Polyangiales bacterium]
MPVRASRHNTPLKPRKRPVQARSKRTVAWIVEGAARVFRAEGFAATTNRIAEQAGVGIGTLYEYFPNKEALLYALAERHVEEAEHGVESALAGDHAAPVLLALLQAAIIGSHRYPSQALSLVTQPELAASLHARVAALRARLLAALTECAREAGDPAPALGGRVLFGLLAELSSLTAHETYSQTDHADITRRLHALALAQLAAHGGSRSPARKPAQRK